MLCKGVFKPAGGKLVRVAIETDGKTIDSIRITGDFFVHPETGIELIEKALAGQQVCKAFGIIEQAIKENGIETFGLDAKSLAEAIKIAVGVEK